MIRETAFETLGGNDAAFPLVMTCEHASSRLPEWSATSADEPILCDHWGWDPGAADLTRALLRRLGGAAVLSRFSRLVCDPNRDPSDQTFVVETVEGHAISWNRGIDAQERQRRQQIYHEPYHQEIERILRGRVASQRPARLLSIHSFTPVYRGEKRDVEVGVLFDDHESSAHELIAEFKRVGLRTEANEPYSGYAGLIHAARRHGRRHRVVYLELEIRQDLIATPKKAAEMAEALSPGVKKYALAANSVTP